MLSKYRRLSEPLLLMAVTVFAVAFNSCKKDPTIPVLITDSATDITINSAILGGNITSDGGAPVTLRGICWGTEDNPTVEGDNMESGTGTGKFSGTVEGLDPNTIYHVRAYAQNSVGIAYGKEVVFATGIAAPIITTSQVSAITATTAVSGGVITYDGGAQITESGICWSTTPAPDLGDSFVLNSSGGSTFSSTLTNLSAGTKYYVRAFVKNSEWTVYGSQMTFITKVADIEGNLYNTVMVGTKVWMAENLKATRLNDNTPLTEITDNTQWINTTTPAYCWYDNNASYKTTYGTLYNWYSVNTAKLCPAGWHVPTDSEYNNMEISLGMAADQADLWGSRGTDHGMKVKNTTGWADNGNGTNTSGLSALPGGYRFGATGEFFLLTTITYWWTATEHDADRGWYRRLDSGLTNVYRASTSKKGGKYVRCVKD